MASTTRPSSRPDQQHTTTTRDDAHDMSTVLADASGGHEDLSERQTATNQNPFTGGYGGGGQHQPPSSQTEHLGLHTPSPATESG